MLFYKQIIKNDWHRIVKDKKILVVLSLVPVFAVAAVIATYIGTDSMNANPEHYRALYSDSLFWAPYLGPSENLGLSFFWALFNQYLPLLFLGIPLTYSLLTGVHLIIEEKERGTIESLMYMPVRLQKVLISKILVIAIPSYLITLLTFFLSILLAGSLAGSTTGFDWPVWTMLLVLLVPSLVLFVNSMIIFLSAVSRSSKDVYQYAAAFLFLILMATQGALLQGVRVFQPAIIAGFAAFLLFASLLVLRFLAGRINYESILYGIKNGIKRQTG